MSLENIGASSTVINSGTVKEIKTAKTPEVKQTEHEKANLSPSDKNNVAVLRKGKVEPSLPLGLEPVFPLKGLEADQFAQKFGFETVAALQGIIGEKPTGIISGESLKNIKNYLEEDIAMLKKGLMEEAGKFFSPEQKEKAGLTDADSITQDTVIDLNNLIQDNLQNMLEAKSFEALLKVMLIEMKNLDMVLSLIR